MGIKPFLFVVFGATGDLMHRKLAPALYRLKKKNLLPKFSILGVARRDKTSEDFRSDIIESVKKYSKKVDLAVLDEFVKDIYYFRNDFDTGSDYIGMRSLMQKLHKKYGTGGNTVFYLATMPGHFSNILDNFRKNKCIERNGAEYKIIIEKPFGFDLKTAKKLNQELSALFTEKEIFRIDHFLGKEAVQNLFALRFANKLFESVWDAEHIDNIQISALENLGVESRGGYYDNYGALKDMVQNHLLQILAIVAMEPPKSYDTESIKKEKLKVLGKVRIKDAVFGQYSKGRDKTYLEEENVKKDSNTETYVALDIHVENKRWTGVPFYLRTGKSLKRKASEIVIYFKNANIPGFAEAKQNVLVIRLQPNEGIYLRFNAKEPGNEFNIQEVSMDFCHECLFVNNTPEAYEKLLLDAFKGDTALFTRWDEVERAWKIIDPIASSKNKLPLFRYASGTWGPEEADRLLLQDNNHWREPL